MADTATKDSPTKFEDLSEDEQAAYMRQQYYGAANTHGGVLSDLLVLAGRMGQYAGAPHYRAIAGAGLTAQALRELKDLDESAAKALFQELADGLLGLGADLDLTGSAGEGEGSE